MPSRSLNTQNKPPTGYQTPNCNSKEGSRVLERESPYTRLWLQSSRIYWAWKIWSPNRWTALLSLSQDEREELFLQVFYFLKKLNRYKHTDSPAFGWRSEARKVKGYPPRGECWLIRVFFQRCWPWHPNRSFGDDGFSSFLLCTFH